MPVFALKAPAGWISPGVRIRIDFNPLYPHFPTALFITHGTMTLHSFLLVSCTWVTSTLSNPAFLLCVISMNACLDKSITRHLSRLFGPLSSTITSTLLPLARFLTLQWL